MSTPETHLYPRRWQALTFIVIAQLMTALDGTIVNIALPTAQADLGISDANRQWVITAYALAFGGLLLLGGKIADQWGRKRTFLTGLAGFAVVSAIGGAATGGPALFIARAGQGAFAALLVPAALSLLASMFTEPKERAKAFGIYGAIAGAGGVLGVVMGGLLTEYATWRWTLLVNVPIAAVAFIGGARVIPEIKAAGPRTRLDIPGVVLSTAGLALLVYAFANAEHAGWSAPLTVVPGIAAVVLLAAFVLVQTKTKDPLLPLRIVTERNRAGAFLVAGLTVVALFADFLFLTYYFQTVLGYSALKTGLAFVPMGLGMIIGAVQLAARASIRFRPRTVMLSGLITAAAGMALLTLITPHTNYLAIVLPGVLLFGLGSGAALMPAVSMATHGVRPEDAGAASALVNTAQQIGGAVGIALLNTLAASATAGYLAGRTTTQAVQLDGLVHGYTTGFWWSVAVLLLAALLAAVLVNAKPPTQAEATGDGGTESAPALMH
ncbi:MULTISPECIES: MFS transporter [Streptomycetaceae]|uniref:Major facilitator superfamily permease n=1 Tax=Streptantibioticus cattleyicolor (strain ATCC 35852 / DSM 46488 / JCM 4925 / NBRC 14057 / NRRL 8057) TaxID=1003195 RepID=F8K1L3_STREN|nr:MULTISPECIES: MFS transporter [Streptomycetaceae]AEW94984.1 major facilitator superfamily permease [Streptantibioticus cattleyicolor NRRL 8057 = DSM 46488]MYS59585.1 DHA2 family efflux MFS transporter permease subunit [Streptomyces sp. SID5468]CCB75336.1 Putative transmembrane transport protein; putative multidrug efflux protein [Streptantibioticus cattleyicolor NRRL 8057 = DSM 46488]